MTGSKVDHYPKALVAVAVLAVLAAVPARAGLTTIQTASAADVKIENPAIGFEIAEATTTAPAAPEVVIAAQVEAVPTRSIAEAPMPSSAISGSVMLIGLAVVRVLRKRKAF